ncbi:MAG TPA: DapH/DapD/GlmU-related protein [Syntrophorhabdus sp.]|nr:DapH/DapD/GlmU-related protein [Syntrophorhabdus sp.]
MKIGKYCEIAEDFKFGENFKCGSFVKIEPDVIVGNNVIIENFVLLKSGTRIGDNVFIDSYVRSSGNNSIGNNVTLRFGSTIAREVKIEDDVFISPNVMTIYSKHTGEKLGGTVIGKGTYVGTNAVIGPGVKIAPNSIIGAMAYIDKDCKYEGVYIGIPAYKK